jgi:hypothetical protein
VYFCYPAVYLPRKLSHQPPGTSLSSCSCDMRMHSCQHVSFASHVTCCRYNLCLGCNYFSDIASPVQNSPSWTVAADEEPALAALVQRASQSKASTSARNKFCKKYGVVGGTVVNRPISSALVAHLAAGVDLPPQAILRHFEACHIGITFAVALCAGAGRLPGGGDQATELCREHAKMPLSRVRSLLEHTIELYT